MAYTFQTLRTRVLKKAQDPNQLLFTDPDFNVVVNNCLKRTIEKIQQTKKDFPSLDTTITFAAADVEESLPVGFWKIIAIQDSVTNANYAFRTIYNRGITPSLYELFLLFDGSDFRWKLIRNPDLPAITLTVFYTYRFDDLATNSTQDLTWLPQSAIDLTENKAAIECLANYDRRNARCEYDENQAMSDLNNWLQSEHTPEFVTYIPR